MMQKIFITIITVLSYTQIAAGMSVQVDDVKMHDENSSDWSFSYTEDASEIEKLSTAAVNKPSERPHFVVISHETKTAKIQNIQHAPNAVVEFDLGSENTSEDQSPDPQQDRREKRTALLVATAQTAASTFSFLYFSDGSMSASATAAIICGILNFYFSWDPLRWGRFLEWGEKRIHSSLKTLGLKKLIGRTSSKLSKVFTGAMGAVGMSFMYGGILAWQYFMDRMIDPVFLTTVTVNGLIASFYTGIWDSVFIQWQKAKVITDVTIRNMWRFKNLFSAFLSPIIYLGIAPAKVVAVGSGVAAMAALWKSEATGRFVKKCSSLLGIK